MDFVTIGNPGNAADTTGSPNPVGRVDYIYYLGKYEISRSMIEKANPNLGLSFEITQTSLRHFGGDGPDRPATGISWNEAARFVNWLNTSKGYHPAYNFEGAREAMINTDIVLWGENQYSGDNRFRHKDAHYFLPSVDEWYKAAYGSPDGTWSDFPTASNNPPVSVVGGTDAGSAVWGMNWPGSPADIYNAGGASAYGTIGQGGNISEWNESAFDGTNDDPSEPREMRGGSWVNSFEYLDASNRQSYGPGLEASEFIGFRIAMVPEPSSLSLLALGGVLVALGRRRQKRA